MPRRSPIFSQLDRLADNEEWRDWKKEGKRSPRQGISGRLNRRASLDQIITGDGVPRTEEE